MIYDVVSLEPVTDIVVRQVKGVVRTVAARRMLCDATTVIASRRQDIPPLALILTLLLVLILVLFCHPTLQVHVLKQEEAAESRVHLDAVVGDLFSVIQVTCIPIYLVVQAPDAFNLRTINRCTVGSIEDDTLV